MPTATPKEVREALQITVSKLKSEGSQRDAVTRALVTLGYRTGPSVQAAKLDGDACRIYVWKNTPAGDILLVTGPAFLPKIVEPSEIAQAGPGIYVLAGKDHTKAAEKASHFAQHYQPRAPRAALPPKVVVTPAPRPPPPARPVAGPARTKQLAKAVVAADLPPPPVATLSAAEAERAQVMNVLAALFKE